MRISILGDSISTFQNMNPPGYTVYYNVTNCMRNSVMTVGDTWWSKVINHYGFDLLINASYSGSRVSGIEFPAAFTYDRINALHNDFYPDIILIYLGYNDFGFDVPLSSEQKTLDSSYFYDAYVIMLRRLKEAYSEAKIICGTMLPNYEFYRPDLTERYRTNSSGKDLNAYNELIRKAYNTTDICIADLYNTGISVDTLDGSHPTKRGHMEMANAWINALNDLL